MATDRPISEMFEDLIQDELDKLNHLRSPKRQRDATIRAVAQAAVDGRSITRLLKDPNRPPNVVSDRTWYHSDKDYFCNMEVKIILSRVEDLYQRRENALKAAADEAARRKRHEENARLIRSGKTLLAAALNDWEMQIQRVSKERALGVENIEAVGMNPLDIARFMTAVLKEERTEFGELPSDKVEAVLEWKDGLPDDITETEADIAINRLVEGMVQRDLDQIMYDDDDSSA